MNRKTELCVATPEAARIADKVGVDRIETCAALEVGGLTPSVGFVSWIKSTFDLEQHVLVRQRAGGFVYTYDEVVIMRDDIQRFRELGVKGIVIGALDKNGGLDTDSLEALMRVAGSMELTFHRAFDEVADWKKTMDKLVNMGFKRILTSGQAPSVFDGLRNLAEMVTYAAGRIEIMAGGGVKPSNKEEVIATGVDAVHFSGTTSSLQDKGSLFQAEMNIPDEALIRSLMA